MTTPRSAALLRALPRTVVALGVVSLLTDLSSEMIYPLLPVFLTGVLGASAVALGLVEGVAEATSSLLKLVSGVLSDRGGRRKPWVVAGYTLAGAVRPLIGLAASWPQVLGLRFADRVGKGLRTSPRDALIADATAGERRGTAFGFHRAMDHAGAVLGPLVAAALLGWGGLELRAVFLWAALPAAASLGVLVFLVRETGGAESRRAEPLPSTSPEPVEGRGPVRTAGAGRSLGGPYRRLLLALLVFTLGNSTDAFLLLKLSEAGLAAGAVALLWSALHFVKMLASWWGGRWADLRGRRSALLAGWLVYAAVYLGFAAADAALPLVALFLAYGVHFGLTEPAERAWVVDLVPAPLRGTALGAYHAVVGLAALPASLLFGLLWTRISPSAAFTTGATLALLAALLLLRVPQDRDA
jgi:MFS family permease